MAHALVDIELLMMQSSGALLLDVRTPAEYAQGHMPGAVNLPLFTNEERPVVGTAYKQQSREAAIKIGLDFFGPKMRMMVETVEDLVDKSQMTDDSSVKSVNSQLSPVIYLYCWRGGMRSEAVAWLLGLYGFKVARLQGGYKAFRQWVLQQFGQPHRLQLLGGYTGSGKTEILQALQQKGASVIDLEALARHKGSTFGNLAQEPQPTQEQFENNLATALYKNKDNTIWLEDESRRIGYIMLPAGLWTQMQEAPLYFLDLPFEQRLQHLVLQYGNYATQQLKGGIQRIAKRMGPQHAKAATEALVAGNITACFTLLLHYYDGVYDKSIRNRPDAGAGIHRIEGTTTGAPNVVYLTPTASYEKT